MSKFPFEYNTILQSSYNNLYNTALQSRVHICVSVCVRVCVAGSPYCVTLACTPPPIMTIAPFCTMYLTKFHSARTRIYCRICGRYVGYELI